MVINMTAWWIKWHWDYYSLILSPLLLFIPELPDINGVVSAFGFVVVHHIMCMKRPRNAAGFPLFVAPCGSMFVWCTCVFVGLMRGKRPPYLNPNALISLVGRQSDGQTNRKAHRQTGWPNIVTDILKYGTMRHSKFVFQPRDPSVWPRINTHTSRRLPCSILYSCVHVWGERGSQLVMQGRLGEERRLILSRWCKQTTRVGSQWLHVHLSVWSRLIILSVANGNLIQKREMNSL